MHLEATFTVTQFTPVELTVADPVATGVSTGAATFGKAFAGDVVGRSSTLFTSAFDPGRGEGTYLAIESFEGTVGGHAGTFAFVHAASTRGTDRFDDYFALVPGSGTAGLAGISGSGALWVDDDGTHRLRLDCTLGAA
ncbi:DUF3224 domain-containing protein [Cellulomonas edaphi]|uniref:DUF3224 domain-containing protein n=1 Tax=Cellulomonas edaphi TaxID=3053468 RepID=A0ABT7SAS6_9CELL|nr:DUF3224 domain-containing protein [Cellulomons edaphi]MDM7832727.1 DUF3224 domain-containing protein [Cellulomons edaphi]